MLFPSRFRWLKADLTAHERRGLVALLVILLLAAIVVVF